MQKLQDSVFSIVKTTNLSSAVFSFLQPTKDTTDQIPLGGILNDTRHAWLALGPKFCVVDLKTGLKIAAKTFGTPYSESRTAVTCVVEIPIPLTDNSKQLIISLSEDIASTICVFHINGSLTLRCIQTDLVVTELAVSGELPDGPFTCFDGVVVGGTRSGEVFVFDLNRAELIQAIEDISQGYEQLVQDENSPATLTFLPSNAIQHIKEQRDLVLENKYHLAILLNESSLADREYLFRNPDGSVRLKAERDQVRVSVLQYISQLGSVVVGYNFGAFQIWNILTLELEYTSTNIESVPVTQFGFQEPCDDPRAFCYLWVVYSPIDRFEDDEFPFAVMYSLTYHGKRMLSDTDKRMLSDTKCLYQEFSMASIRFQVELSAMEEASNLVGGKCVSCHTYSISTMLGTEGEDSMLNMCQLVWECWGDSANTPSQYGMLLFDLDQWYKGQMPETCRLQSNAFMSATWCSELEGACTLDARLQPLSVATYSHATRLEEHFFPNSLQYQCVCLTTSEAHVLSTVGIQRQIINSLDAEGPTALLNPTRLYLACLSAGLSPLYIYHDTASRSQEDQRRFMLSVALEARLSRFLTRCAHDWATGSHTGAGCTLPFLVDWSWKRALELKEYAKELTAPLFSSSALPDRNVVRCLEHCVQQLTQLSGLLDAVLTKCCNLVVPDALSEMEEKYKGIGTVALYFQVVQWFLRVGLLPERHHAAPYPTHQLYCIYNKRRLKLQRLEENAPLEDLPTKSCSLLYIDQLIENEFGGERIHEMWRKGGSECNGLYPPPSLYALLRLYLLPDVDAEHKHSLALYLLVDYSALYEQSRYETVIRRLMQFPTMFGLSNTAIKATQAFWHLDHRDFNFALDQLQCLTGNTLSKWQHNVVLSSLLAQKKTQAALQYLHVRKPPPIQIRDANGLNNSRMNDHDKLDDWQPCCNLYLERGLVFEALDVIRMVVQNCDEKEEVLNYFYKGCRNTGQLAKIMQVTLSPFEEEVFIKYLKNCNEPQTSDILVMYYLQQTRYIEAEQYNLTLRHNKNKVKESLGSAESLADILDRESTRDTIVEIACASLPAVANCVRDYVLRTDRKEDVEPHILVPKPLSVYVQAKSPKNKFTYKSSFIQDTIENASEIWINKPKLKKGLKRALNIEETPFICTPKLTRNRSILAENAESTPPKRAKLDFKSTPKTPNFGSASKFNANLSKQMATLLDMPEIQSPECKLYLERSGAETPHSILKIRRSEMDREGSPVDSRYLADTDDEMLETASIHTQFSDSTNKHLRFTIPAVSESDTASPSIASLRVQPESEKGTETYILHKIESDGHNTTDTHTIDETHPLESPPKKLATESTVKTRRAYKDTVRARHSLSISANSSLSDDPNTSIESIADIPITLINPRYCGGRKKSLDKETTEREKQVHAEKREKDGDTSEVPKKPTGRKGIRSVSRERTPIRNRSRSRTPERMEKGTMESPKLERISESPTKAAIPEPSSPRRSLRSRSRTPEVEIAQEQRPVSPRSTRSRAKTPEKVMSPKFEHSTRAKKSLSRIVLEANAFATTKTNLENNEQSKTEQSEKAIECTPMKTIKQVQSLMDVTLSPIVNKSILQSSTDSVMSDTEEKDSAKLVDKSTTDLGLKPLPNFTTLHETYYEKSVLLSYQSSVADSSQSIQEKSEFHNDELPVGNVGIKTLPAFTTLHETGVKSVLHSYESSVAESSDNESLRVDQQTKSTEGYSVFKPFSTFTQSFQKSVLRSCQSSIAESSQDVNTSKLKDDESALKNTSLITNDSDSEIKDDQQWQSKIDSQATASVIQKEKEKIVDIEREINELEGDMTDDESGGEENSSSDEEIVVAPNSDQSTEESSSSDEEPDDDSASDEEIISIKDTDSEKSSVSMNALEYEDDNTNETNNQEQAKIQTIVEINVQHIANEKAEQKDALAQTSMLTDDNSEAESDRSAVHLNYSDENILTDPGVEENVVASSITAEKTTTEQKEALSQISMITDDNSTIIANENKKIEEETSKDDSMDIELNDRISMIDDVSKEKTKSTNVDPIDMDVADSIGFTEVKTKSSVDEQSIFDVSKEKHKKITSSSAKDDNAKNRKETVADKNKMELGTEENKQEETKMQTQESKKSIKPAPRTTRARSASSNKSITDIVEETQDEPSTPTTRRRSKSVSSKTDVEQKTPENVQTPRRRPKTPTSTEVRKIITRRASRELETLDESKEILDKSINLTPSRRSARSKSKTQDDNESVASESSVKSSRSKASEEVGDVKPAPVRKGRKSILSTKPDLSVIPESVVEEDSKGTADIMQEYSTARRLTRHQKTLLESWLGPGGRPTSAASEVSATRDDDDASSTHSGLDTQSERLAKLDYEGSPETESHRTGSPDSFASEASRIRRSRLGRAASETKTTPKSIKSIRRMSVDVVESPDLGSPVGASPSRGRRASFNKACEALHTPKGRRPSTDTRKDTESPSTSPDAESRRERRAPSQAKSDSSRRSKKTTASDESGDGKKK